MVIDEFDIIQIKFVASTLMKLKVIASVVGSAYIQAFRREILFVISGPKFVKWERFNIIIFRALY